MSDWLSRKLMPQSASWLAISGSKTMSQLSVGPSSPIRSWTMSTFQPMPFVPQA
jgi:hypothetical protein